MKKTIINLSLTFTISYTGCTDNNPSDPLDDINSSTADMTSDTPKDIDAQTCSVDCACGGTCEDGIVTLYGTGGSWSGMCSQAPECDPIVTYQCPHGCAQDVPPSSEPERLCQAAQYASAGDWADFCAPEK